MQCQFQQAEAVRGCDGQLEGRDMMEGFSAASFHPQKVMAVMQAAYKQGGAETAGTSCNSCELLLC